MLSRKRAHVPLMYRGRNRTRVVCFSQLLYSYMISVYHTGQKRQHLHLTRSSGQTGSPGLRPLNFVSGCVCSDDAYVLLSEGTSGLGILSLTVPALAPPLVT